jgi:hypothetical protein
MGFRTLTRQLLLLLLLPAILEAELIYPLGNTIFSFDYERLFRIGVAQQNLSYLPSVGPYYFDVAETIFEKENSPALRLFKTRSETNFNQQLRAFGLGSEKLRAIRNQPTDEFPSLVGGFAYRPAKHFGVISLFNLDRAKAVDPDYTGKKYRGLAGDLETAAIFYKNGRFSASLGRQRLYWGPQRTNLILSETTEPLDLLSASFETGRLKGSFIFARLDGSRPNQIDSLRFPDRSFNDNRYLVGHRLDIRLHRRFRLGLFETVLYGGEGRPPELYYLNPMQFFHSAQLNENEDDNTALGFDFILLPGKGTNIYGQLLVDDFQIDSHSTGDNEPAEVGFLFGIFKASRIGSIIPDLNLEYVRITNRTYHQRDPRNRYLFRNKLTGHPLGPDADSISIKARFWPEKALYAEIEVAYRRKGEGSIYGPWDESFIFASSDYSEPFPTGVVERATMLAIRTKGYLPISRYTRDHFFFSAAAGWGETENTLNIGGSNSTSAWLEISLTWLGYLDVPVD